MKNTAIVLLTLAIAACDGDPTPGGAAADATDTAAPDGHAADAADDVQGPAPDAAGEPDTADGGPADVNEGADAVADAAQDTQAPADAADAADATDAPGSADAPDSTDAGPPGPAVGVTMLTVTTPAGRQLPTAVWYPALDDGTQTPEAYLGLLAGEALRDAPVAEGGPWPLIVFSHGSQAMKEQSIFLTEQLTKHGYVVAAPDHVGNTFLTQNDAMMAEVARERPRDVSAIIDRLQAPDAGDPAWFGSAIDFEHIGAAGHSFGGYTVMALAGGILSVPQEVVDACAEKPGDLICGVIGQGDPGPLDLRDDRVDVVVAMTPGGYQAFRTEGLAHVAVPTMVMAGLADEVTVYEEEPLPFFEGIPGTKYLWSLEHGVHFTWSDFCQIIPFIGEEMAAQFGAEMCEPDAPLPIGVAHDLIFDMTLAMFDAWLRGDPEAAARLVPAWAEAQSPEVSMTVGP